MDADVERAITEVERAARRLRRIAARAEYAEQDRQSLRDWGIKNAAEVRRLEDRCSMLWNLLTPEVKEQLAEAARLEDEGTALDGGTSDA